MEQIYLKGLMPDEVEEKVVRQLARILPKGEGQQPDLIQAAHVLARLKTYLLQVDSARKEVEAIWSKDYETAIKASAALGRLSREAATALLADYSTGRLEPLAWIAMLRHGAEIGRSPGAQEKVTELVGRATRDIAKTDIPASTIFQRATTMLPKQLEIAYKTKRWPAWYVAEEAITQQEAKAASTLAATQALTQPAIFEKAVTARSPLMLPVAVRLMRAAATRFRGR